MTGKIRSLIAVILFINTSAFSGTDSVSVKPKSSCWLIPDGVSVEYAGGFGLASAGMLYGKKNADLELNVGYIPRAYGNIWTTNLLLSYTILPLKLSNFAQLHLLKAGAFVNFNHGKNLYISWPEKYPRNYYWWNSSIRFGPFINTELKLKPARKDISYTIFFQCLTNDLYLYSYFPNRGFLSLTEFIYFGAGIKIHLGAASRIR